MCLNNQISRAPLDSHDGVLQHVGAARGGADAHEYRPQPPAVRNDARFPRQRTRTFRARRSRVTSCQTARASAHRALHLDGPGTKARACSWRHAIAQTLGDGTEQRVYRPAEGEAFRREYVPRRCVLPLFTISPAKAPSADKTLFALRRKLEKHSESPK